MLIKENSKILFQGDSITDSGRDKNDTNSLGAGYAMMAAAWANYYCPGKNVKVINRGASGDRIIDMENRWQKDCIDIKPDIVSILIGINDTWRRYDSNDPTSTKDFQERYRRVLTRTKRELDCSLVICEPFVLPYPEDRKKWREDLDPKIEVARKLAKEFNALFIPFDKMFAELSSKTGPSFWAEDGVHPTIPGHAFMAQSWLKAITAS